MYSDLCPIARCCTQTSFDDYNRAAETKSDRFNKRFFRNAPCNVSDTFNVAVVGPVVHYTMGGVSGDEHGRVLRPDGSVIPGLYCAGECLGGVHGMYSLPEITRMLNTHIMLLGLLI